VDIIVMTKIPTRSQHLRDMAWECRQLAGAMVDRGVRLDLLLIAEKFELLAHARDSEWGTKLSEAKTSAVLKSGY